MNDNLGRCGVFPLGSPWRIKFAGDKEKVIKQRAKNFLDYCTLLRNTVETYRYVMLTFKQLWLLHVFSSCGRLPFYVNAHKILLLYVCIIRVRDEWSDSLTKISLECKVFHNFCKTSTQTSQLFLHQHSVTMHCWHPKYISGHHQWDFGAVWK